MYFFTFRTIICVRSLEPWNKKRRSLICQAIIMCQSEVSLLFVIGSHVLLTVTECAACLDRSLDV